MKNDIPKIAGRNKNLELDGRSGNYKIFVEVLIFHLPKINMTRNSRRQILNKAGRDMARAKSSVPEIIKLVMILFMSIMR